MKIAFWYSWSNDMIRAGIGFDSHRFMQGRKLVIGGVDIPHEAGLDGNSDADVLCHAIMDAMLGAVAAGDIGTHFPDNDSRWTNAWSIELMNHVADILREKKTKIVNIDSTVIAEEPRMSPHIASMRTNIANAVGINESAVSVKATTVEQMGALGRKEGMAALAVVLVETEAG